MTLIELYAPVKLTHISSVLLSGAIFTFRAALDQCRFALAHNPTLKRFSYANDSLLLITGLSLMVITQQYPITHDWLTVKLTLVLVYIALGIMALRKGRTPLVRRVFFVAALCVYLFIISIARSHHPLGVFVSHSLF